MIAPLLATHVRKARWQQAYRPCVLCGRVIRISNRVGLLPEGWAHTGCINDANKITDEEQ